MSAQPISQAQPRRVYRAGTANGDDGGGDAPVYSDRFAPRQVERSECDERPGAPTREERAEHAAGETEHPTLEQSRTQDGSRVRA